jgi:hypothetical protein
VHQAPNSSFGCKCCVAPGVEFVFSCSFTRVLHQVSNSWSVVVSFMFVASGVEFGIFCSCGASGDEFVIRCIFGCVRRGIRYLLSSGCIRLIIDYF